MHLKGRRMGATKLVEEAGLIAEY